MPELGVSLLVSAFITGVLMFLAPCTLPLVPAFLSFIAGVRYTNDTHETNQRYVKHQIRINALFFVLGFSLIFVLFGTLAGLLGVLVGELRTVFAQVGGVLLIFFGLTQLGLFTSWGHTRLFRGGMPSSLTPGTPKSSFLIGSTFALGWTPCVGPILATILFLASTGDTAVAGGFLLFVFSLGLAVPFLLVAFLFEAVSERLVKYSRYALFLTRLGGVFLILIGIVLVFNNFSLFIEYGYDLFRFFGLEGFFDML